MTINLECEGSAYSVEFDGPRYSVNSGSETATVIEIGPGTYSVLFSDGQSVAVDIRESPSGLLALTAGSQFEISLVDPRDRKAATRTGNLSGSNQVRSQMPGKIVRVLVEEGQTVEAGSGLLVIEAMKMQNEAKSPKSGTVKAIKVKEGATVAAGELLAVVE